jgi:hypothetical protein
MGKHRVYMDSPHPILKRGKDAPLLFRAAAAIAAAAPFAALLLFEGGILESRLGANWLRGSLGWALTTVALILVISGFTGGVIALCGIPRHGARGLLWKGLIGVVAFGVVLVISVLDVVRITAEVSKH